MFSETDRLFLKTTFERGRYTISHQFNFLDLIIEKMKRSYIIVFDNVIPIGSILLNLFQSYFNLLSKILIIKIRFSVHKLLKKYIYITFKSKILLS